jgi:hypothetical protein
MLEEKMEEIKKSRESNENENTTYQNPWNKAKAVLKKEADSYECLH